MANLKDIRRRIKSINNTAQITKAMQMVAAAKMKKAQNQALAGREYADRLNLVLTNLKANMEGLAHPYLEVRDDGKHLVLIISTDKGLCGGINTNLLKKVRAEIKDTADYSTVGKKLKEQVLKAGDNLVKDFTIEDPVHFDEIKPIAKHLTEEFLNGDYNKVSVCFTNFVSTLVQDPHVYQLLPIDPSTLAEKQDYEGVGKGKVTETNTVAALEKEYTFEPSPNAVLNSLLPQYVSFQIYQMIVEARASEHSARMVAMKAATDNANDLAKDLKLEYNKLRQAAITAELLEITTAMKALE
ncbi:MAG: ATP synthase F1 subunit gamma [Akkermansiaceae bacterium]